MLNFKQLHERFCRCFPDVDSKVILSAFYLGCALLDLFGVVTKNILVCDMRNVLLKIYGGG